MTQAFCPSIEKESDLRDGLLSIRSYVIPRTVLLDTVAFLQMVGREGFEGFVLWGGVRVGKDVLEYRSALIPKQRASRTANGLLVTVQGEALFAVNRELHGRGELLAAQVHSHPTRAYHSSTDDDFPMVTLMGSLSIVVPNFARNALDGVGEWACYRLTRQSKWEPIDDSIALELR